MNDNTTQFEDFYNRKIDDILAIINALDIICQTEDFRHWITTTHHLTDDADLLTGYIFLIDVLTRRLHDELARNVSLGLTEDEAFGRADSHGTPLERLPDTGEKTKLLKAIRRRVDPILHSKTWSELQTSLEIFRQEVIRPMLALKTISQLNAAYSISSMDEAIKYSTMNEVFVFLNDTSEHVPHGYPTPTLNSSLWRSHTSEAEQYLLAAFEGYKYSNQYLWGRLLVPEFPSTPLTRIHEAKDWSEFDRYFDVLRHIIDPIEQRIGARLGVAPTILISQSGKSVLRSLLRGKASGRRLNNLEKLEHLFQWYQIELVDASRGTLFNGAPALLSAIAGSVELKKRLGISAPPTHVIKLTHPDGPKRNTYSYAILMEISGLISDASGWLLFFGCCYDYTGTGLAQLRRVDDLIAEYSHNGSVTKAEHRITKSDFLRLMEPYLLFPPRRQPRVSPKEKRLQEIRETAEINEVLHETQDMLGTARGLLLEVLEYYAFSNPDNSRIEWNYKRNNLQIDLLLRTQKELRFFECKTPLGTLLSEARYFKLKVQSLMSDSQFKREWDLTLPLIPTLTFVLWRRPEYHIRRQLIDLGIDVVVLKEQLLSNRKFLDKEKDKIRHVFGDT